MGLDYSQKRLVGAPLRGKHDKHSQRLRFYAFLTGIMSVVISFVDFVLHVLIKLHH